MKTMTSQHRGVVVSRNVSTSYNTNSASISSGSSGSITRVYGDSSQTSAGSSGSSAPVVVMVTKNARKY